MTLPIPRAALAQHTIVLGKTGAGAQGERGPYLDDDFAGSPPGQFDFSRASASPA